MAHDISLRVSVTCNDYTYFRPRVTPEICTLLWRTCGERSWCLPYSSCVVLVVRGCALLLLIVFSPVTHLFMRLVLNVAVACLTPRASSSWCHKEVERSWCLPYSSCVVLVVRGCALLLLLVFSPVIQYTYCKNAHIIEWTYI